MSGTTKLADKIIADADGECAQIIAVAKQKAEETLHKVDEQIEAEQHRLDEQCTADAKEITRRRLTLANLDAKKEHLFAMQQLVEDVYSQSITTLMAEGKSYLKLITKLIKQYAENGETVTICANDKGRITQKFLDGFNKKLTLNSAYGLFDGGIMLSKAGYDKNLTLSLVFRQLREQTENEVTKLLFGDNNANG